MHNITILAKRQPAGIPIITAVEEYLTAIRRRVRPGTREGYSQRLRTFAAWAESAGVTLEDIDAGIVNNFLDHLAATHKNKRGLVVSLRTQDGYAMCIKVFLKWCARDRARYSDFVDERTAREIERPKLDQVIIETFTDSDVRALILAAKEDKNPYLAARNEAIVHLLIGTGIRAAELCGLKMGDVHIDDGSRESWIVVFGKGHKSRKIPLGPVTRRKLSRYLEDWREDATDATPVFTERFGKRPLTVAGLEQVIKKLGKLAHVQPCHPHLFRHSFAVEFMRRGGNVYHLSRLLGHENILTTQNYLRGLGAETDWSELVAAQMR